MTTIFVYGTLRRGFYNNYLLKNQQFVAEGRTFPEFTMESKGTFPGVAQVGNTEIVGEVWNVDPECLNSLDALEGHPDWYTRTRITLKDGTACEIYLQPAIEDPDAIVESGDWAEFRGMRRY